VRYGSCARSKSKSPAAPVYVVLNDPNLGLAKPSTSNGLLGMRMAKLIFSLLNNGNKQVSAGIEKRIDLALKYLEGGKSLVDKDPVQASEELYKAAEEAVKALAHRLALDDVLKKVGERGGWTVTELERAVLRISDKLGEWFRHSWNSAWVLHVWGFHEAKLDPDYVRRQVPDVERMVLEARKAVAYCVAFITVR